MRSTPRRAVTTPDAAQPRRRATRKGWRIAGGGYASLVTPVPEYRGTSVQVCGLWPFSAGSGTPITGVPLGRHLDTGATVCGDPINWFLARLILNPSAFVLGRPGLGKSSLIRHIITMLPSWGILPMVLSDLKPDHVRVIQALDGQVITLGRGQENLNPLDLGPVAAHLGAIQDARLRREAREDLEGRRVNLLIGLCELARGEKLSDREQTILTAALRVVDREVRDRQPVISDVRELIANGFGRKELEGVVRDRGDVDRYHEITERLLDALQTLDANGPFGDTFARETSTPMDLDRPVCFDVSAVDDADLKLQAGLQLVCWSYGSSAISCAQYLSEAGLRPKRIYLLVMDELWRMLRASEVMVDRVDAITRLNRQRGIGQMMATHTMDDLKMPTAEATAKARGFVERSAMVFLGGLAEREMGNLEEVFGMSMAEKKRITGWADDVGFSPESGTAAEPPGMGKFILKTGKRPGIPFRVELTSAELAVNDTNLAWHELQRARLGQHALGGTNRSAVQ